MQTQQRNQPTALAVPALAARHRHKPTVKTTFPQSLCTSLGQSAVPAKLWGSLSVEELNMCCDLARAQALMDGVWLHPSHSGPDDRWTQCGCLQRQTDQTPTRSTHPNLDVLVQLWAPLVCVEGTFSISLLSCFSVCLSIMLRAHAEVQIYHKLLHRSHLLEPRWSILCSGVNILLDSPTAVSNLS